MFKNFIKIKVFFNSGLNLCNNLPLDRHLPNIYHFKKAIKTLLLNDQAISQISCFSSSLIFMFSVFFKILLHNIFSSLPTGWCYMLVTCTCVRPLGWGRLRSCVYHSYKLLDCMCN